MAFKLTNAPFPLKDDKNKRAKSTLSKVMNIETGEVYPQRGKFMKTAKKLERAKMPKKAEAIPLKGKPVKRETKTDKKPHSPRFHGLSQERIAKIKAKDRKKRGAKLMKTKDRPAGPVEQRMRVIAKTQVRKQR